MLSDAEGIRINQFGIVAVDTVPKTQQLVRVGFDADGSFKHPIRTRKGV